MDIRQVLNLPELLDVKSVVVIEPHPDDNEVGAGGTVMKLVGQGCEVTFVTVTDGGAGWWKPGLKREDVTEVRRQERAKAAEILGVKRFYNLGFEDGGAYTEEEVAAKLIPLLRNIKPELVMTVDPWMPYEAHPDHIKTGRAVAQSLLFCGNPAFMEGEGEPWAVPQIAFYGSSYPNTFIDVTETWQGKLDAMLAHKCQFDNEEWPLMAEFLRLEASQLYARSHGNGDRGEDSQSNGSQSNGGLVNGGQSNGGQGNAGSIGIVSSASSDSADGAAPRLAEAFKVLATRQLHFFPTAVYS